MRNLVCRSKTNLNLCLETKFYVEYLYVRDMKERGIGDWAVTRWEASEFVTRIICYADPSGCAVCGRLVFGIEGSNPARGMDVCLLCLYVVLCCVGRGLCDGLITRPEETCRVSNCMCDHRNPERGPMFQLVTFRKMNE
jgi:hypothetical protein